MVNTDVHIRVIEDTSSFTPVMTIVLVAPDELGYAADDDIDYANELFMNDCPDFDADIEPENPYNTYLVPVEVAMTLLGTIANSNQHTPYGGTIREVITAMAKGD